LHGKPVIIYTLEHFELHPDVDNIVIVCVESWIHELKHLLKQYAFDKVSLIMPGGSSGGKSVFNGLQSLNGICSSEDIVLIHDGVRPLINAELISENIAKVKEYGNAITAAEVTDSAVRLDGGNRITEVLSSGCMYIKTPQSFRYGLIWDLYQKAQKDGKKITDSADLCSMYGVKMYIVKSTRNNIKITTPEDCYIFRAIYEATEKQHILGI